MALGYFVPCASLEEFTAKNWRGGSRHRAGMVSYDFFDGRVSHATTQMSTRGGYSSAKEEFAISAINQCVTGGLDAEMFSEIPIQIKVYANSRNGPRLAN